MTSGKGHNAKFLAAGLGMVVLAVVQLIDGMDGTFLRRLAEVGSETVPSPDDLQEQIQFQYTKHWAGHNLEMKDQDLKDELIARWEERVEKRNQYVKDHNVKQWGRANEFGRVWDIYHADWHCPFAERIGSPGDGGKWICNLPEFEQDTDCVVYSLGLFDNDEFERAVRDNAPSCEIHSFDPTPGEIEKFHMDRRLADYDAHFHNYAITADGADLEISSMLHEKPVTVQSKTLYDVMDELNHDHISVLKVDIEFSEWDIFDSLLCDIKDPNCRPLPTDQVLIELHFRDAAETASLFERMAEHGFAIFSFEPNPIGYPGASEFAFIRVKDPRA